MPVSDARAELLVAKAAIERALATLAGAQGLALPEGVCRHEKRQQSMGGWYVCLACGARWQDTKGAP